MKLTNFEESEMERAGDTHIGEIEQKLAMEAWLEAADIAYQNWRDMQVENVFNKVK